jgi:UDP-N-acetylglucosamine 2-epimerase (non-hydrolysing)
VQELGFRRADFAVTVVATAQHRQMLDQVLRLFGIRPDFDLDIMRPGQTLTDVAVRAITGAGRVLDTERPDVVVVQGDTSTAFVSALAAFYRRIPVAHVEAGLRTGDKLAPFPEEMNRRLISAIADLHFAPTRAARANLLREDVPGRSITVTGNTVVDALKRIAGRKDLRLPQPVARLDPSRRVVLVTAHRRESFGPGLDSVCRAIARIAREHPDIVVVYPVHPNPNVRVPVERRLRGCERVLLIPPLEYGAFVALMRRSHLILTDSGGIQEEAPALGKPVLVLRDKTERPEAIAAGTARLVGTGEERILRQARLLLTSARVYARMARAANPFGDGRASQRIARILARLKQ